ncbi:MAG: hypothetical protein IPN97_11635 [Saprospiraceae bacterium]|nr:hypothetical protein [Saprospiraceae bacterium]
MHIRFLVYFFVTPKAQPYTDYIAGHHKGAVVTSSNDDQRGIFLKRRKVKTISGEGLTETK